MEEAIEAHILALKCNPLTSALTPVAPDAHLRDAKHTLPSHDHRPAYAYLPGIIAQHYSMFAPTLEFNFKMWTFLSEDEIEARRLQMVANGQTRMVDFAMRYAGLGHVIVLSYDPEGDKVFARLDGGSNTYDRVINLERAIAMDPSCTPHSFSTRECIRRILADEPIEV